MQYNDITILSLPNKTGSFVIREAWGTCRWFQRREHNNTHHNIGGYCSRSKHPPSTLLNLINHGSCVLAFYQTTSSFIYIISASSPPKRLGLQQWFRNLYVVVKLYVWMDDEINLHKNPSSQRCVCSEI